MQSRRGSHPNIAEDLQQAPHSHQDSDEPVIKSTDMIEPMQQHVIKTAQQAMQQGKDQGLKSSELHNLIARTLKKEFDASYGAVWHAVVGVQFGSQVIHQSRTFMYCYLGKIAVLLWKSGAPTL